MVQKGNNSGLAVLEVSNGYVEIDPESICNREALWERLKQSLLDELAVRRAPRPRKGRPARGPGSAQLGGTEADRIALIRETYNDITHAKQRPAQYAEVARRLGISTTTLWRFRNKFGWPP